MSATDQLASDDPRIGLVLLDRYRIVKKLGEGGMGYVYEGVHELIGKKLAIKCLHADFSANTEAVARFKREARAATAVGNEHIVDVSDIGELPDGSPFMVMEFLKGQELAGLINAHNKLPIPRVIKIALEILEALQAAHDCGVVHRDMKPENVFLIERGENPDFVKVLDFGISMITEHADAAKGRMTQTGVAMGTPNYMSPEQAMGDRNLDHRTDIYSVGVILYECLTRQVPFQSGTLAVLMTQILMDSPKPIRDVRTDVPIALDRIILRAMAKEPVVRYENAEEFADALRPFLDPNYVAGNSIAGPMLNETIELPTGKRQPEVAVTAELPSSDADPSLVAEQTKRIDKDIAKPAFSQETLHAAGIDRSSNKRWIALAGAAVVAAGVGIFILNAADSSSSKAIAAERVGETVPVTQPVPPTESISVLEPQAPINTTSKEVLVKITATPPEAQVFINGTPFPNGSEVHQPRSTGSTQIMIVLDGYKIRNEVAIFDTDRALDYTLEKLVVETATGTNRGKRNGKRGKPVTENTTKPTNENNTNSNTNTEPTEPKSKFRDEFK